MEPPTPTPYVRGGKFLAAYRKLSTRLEELDPESGAQKRTPRQDGCEAIPCWRPHSTAYVLGNADEDVALEIAAALSQFEPVTVFVEGRQSYIRARRSLPDHIRLVQLFDVPSKWSEANPVSFAYARAGDVRLIEYNCAKAPQGAKSTVFRQICEVERIQRYQGPELLRGSTLAPEQPFVEVNGRGQALLSPEHDDSDIEEASSREEGKYISPMRPNEMALFVEGQRNIVCMPNSRFAEDGGIIVPRTTTKASSEALKSQISPIHQLDGRYMGFYIANGGILVPSYNNPEIDLRAMKVLSALFPRRRVVQIQTNRSSLNINEYVLGMPGSVARNLPASSIARASAALTQMNEAQQEVLRHRMVMDRRRTRKFHMHFADEDDQLSRHESKSSFTDHDMSGGAEHRLSFRKSKPTSLLHSFDGGSNQETVLLESESKSRPNDNLSIVEQALTKESPAHSNENISDAEESPSRHISSQHEDDAESLQDAQEEPKSNSISGHSNDDSLKQLAPLEPPIDPDTVGIADDPQDNVAFLEPPTVNAEQRKTFGNLFRKVSTRKSKVASLKKA